MDFLAFEPGANPAYTDEISDVVSPCQPNSDVMSPDKTGKIGTNQHIEWSQVQPSSDSRIGNNHTMKAVKFAQTTLAPNPWEQLES